MFTRVLCLGSTLRMVNGGDDDDNVGALVGRMCNPNGMKVNVGCVRVKQIYTFPLEAVDDDDDADGTCRR